MRFATSRLPFSWNPDFTKEKTMNFIERLFGFSLDGGSGMFEFLVLAVPIVVLSVVHCTRSVQSKRKT